jgi:hypothetical protein
MDQGLTCAGGLLVYLSLCGIALLAGLGLLRLGKFRLPDRAAGLLAPFLTLLVWTLVLALAGVLSIPVKRVAPWLWAATVLLGCHGLLSGRAGLRSAGPILLYCVSLPVVVMAGYFWNGLSDHSGSISPDGWAYVAGGQFFWDYPRGTDGGVEPLYQFASIFNHSRYIAFSLLGFLSPLVRVGDTQAVGALLQAWSLFTMAGAVALFWTVFRSRTWLLWAGTGMATVAGWMANLVWANNLDNGLALAYLPAFAGVLHLLHPRAGRWWLLLGAMTAGILFTYPEMAFVILGGAGLIALPRFWRERSCWPAWLRGTALAAGLAFLFVLPFAGDLVSFVKLQFLISQRNENRPGADLFKGLVMAKYRAGAFWGLGGEHQAQRLNRLRKMLGILLTAALLAGLVVLARQGQWGLAAATILLLCGSLYFLFREHYAYAAYKLIVLNWWGLTAGVLVGVDWTLAWVRRVRLKQGLVFLCCLLGGCMLLLAWLPRQALATLYFNNPYQDSPLSEFRKVVEIKPIVGSQPILLAVDNWLANEWAIYFLRDRLTYLATYRWYMDNPGMWDVMKRARTPALADIGWVLTDTSFAARSGMARRFHLAWSEGPYQLWHFEQPEWVFLTNVRTVDGMQEHAGKMFFWMDREPTGLEVVASRPGMVRFEGTLVPGPAGSLPRRMLFTTAQGRQFRAVLRGKRLIFSVPLQAGRNMIALKIKDLPSPAPYADGPGKVPLAGVLGLRVSLTK